jgi:signal transduction histidine kinase
MRKKRQEYERIRLLILQLAVVLPALALIAFGIMHLKSIRRDRAVEAAIQRDFEQMLLLTEKQMATRAYDMVGAARADFPVPGPSVESALKRVLDKYPYAAHAYLFDKDSGAALVSQPSIMGNPDLREERNKLQTSLTGWFNLEGKEIVEKLWKMNKQDGRPYMFDYVWAEHGNKKEYRSIVLFPLANVPEDRVTIGAIAFDPEYMKNTFFPQALNFMAECPTAPAANNDRNRTALMLHAKREPEVLATSNNWDGGKPEVERTMEAAFPGLVLAAKYQGTTVAAIGDKFLRTSYLILASLSVLMIGGIFLSYRSVQKEVALAKMKSDFVSNVSHELRTPLSLIRLYAETLEMGRLKNPDKYQEYYQTIRKESERLTALINNILDFSRIEAGKKEYEFRETDVGELVHNTLDSYRYQIEQSGFAIDEEIEDGLPLLQADREAIARSLVNLINNAVKYSADDKSLAVRVYRSNGSVNLEVADHGIGIPRSEQTKIFEKFYRVSDPLVHNTKGSGLGLSLVSHVVHAHGGQVWVDSTPGHGSRFTVLLPVDPNAKLHSAAKARSQSGAA